MAVDAAACGHDRDSAGTIFTDLAAPCYGGGVGLA